MDGVEAIYSALSTAITADTGAGGLLNTTGNQYVRGGVVRAGHPRRTENVPFLTIDVRPGESNTEIRHVDALVAITIEDHRDQQFTRTNAVAERLIALLNESTALTASGWTIWPPSFIGTEQVGPVEDARFAHVVRLRVHASVGAIGYPVTGPLMRFTWSLTTEGPTVETLGRVYGIEDRVQAFDGTRESDDTYNRVTPGMKDATLDVEFLVSSGTSPLLPVGAIGTAVLYLNKAAGGRSYTCQAKCLGMSVGGALDAMGEPQRNRYRFHVSNNGVTAGIVVA